MKCENCPYLKVSHVDSDRGDHIEYNCKIVPSRLGLGKSFYPNHGDTDKQKKESQRIIWFHKIGHTGICECSAELKMKLMEAYKDACKVEKKPYFPPDPPPYKERRHTWMEEWDDEDRPY